MKIEIDKNNLLTIANENIPQTKEYTYQVSGYTFSDFDKWMIVVHKKEVKIINLKNLGDTMSVVYIKDQEFKKLCTPFQNSEEYKKTGINTAMKIFQWFDEEIGKKYYFIPWLGEVQQQEKNTIFKKLWIAYSIEKTPKGMILSGIEDDANEISLLGYFFGLMLIYGKWEDKGDALNSIKIQIPLAGHYLAHEEDLDVRIDMLQRRGIFLKADKLPNKNGMVYQISSNDYELLEIFAQWYQAVEKFEKITKHEFTQEMKIAVIEFIETNPEIPEEWKAEVLKQLKEWVIKLLTK